MKKACFILIGIVMMITFLVPPAGSDLQPVVGLTLFGGAERGSDVHADGIGGTEILGLLPLGKRFGLQGSLLNQGGHGGYKLGVSAGPVYAYDSGKFGLFGDYVHRNRGDNNFFFLRGVWSHYFTNFDLVLSYTQPAHSVQRTRRTVTDIIDQATGCGSATVIRNRVVNAREPSINELKGVVRYYPTPQIELNGGLLVNSFAGPDRNKTGTGFGGIFGMAFQALDWLIIRPVQGQMDTRERYRITSGVEFVWAPTQEQYSRQRAQEKDAAFSVASPSGSPATGCGQGT
jgi:hypothetical protein